MLLWLCVRTFGGRRLFRLSGCMLFGGFYLQLQFDSHLLLYGFAENCTLLDRASDALRCMGMHGRSWPRMGWCLQFRFP